MDGAQVGVLEQTDQICLAGLLQSHDGRALEAQIGLEVLSNLTDETLEGQLANQQLGALLVTTNLTKSDCSRPVTMGLLHAASSWCALSGCLRCKLLPGSLATGRLTSSLLRTCHDLSSFSLSSTNVQRKYVVKVPPRSASSLYRLEQRAVGYVVSDWSLWSRSYHLDP